MSYLQPFNLEDFFDEFEHRPGLINLASSDAQPWDAGDLEVFSAKSRAGVSPFSLNYPDVKSSLIPALVSVCAPPHGSSVLPTAGGAEAIALVMHWLAVGDSRKSVAVPEPSYGAFHGLAQLLNLKIHTYSYDRAKGWQPNLQELKRLANTSDAIVVINPHNPTGHVIKRAVLTSLADTLTDQGRTLIVDEVLRVPSESVSAAKLAGNVIVIGSLSKTYGLPGLRLGWVVASSKNLGTMRTIQQYLSLSASAFTSAVATDVLSRLHKFSRAKLVERNRQILSDWALDNKKHVRISKPLGGTTVVMECKGNRSSKELLDAFLANEVLLIPDRCFNHTGKPPWFRLGYGTCTETLQKGLEKVIHALSQIT